MAGMRDRVRAANAARYETPDEVAAYTQEPYHRMRLDLAADLMARGLAGAPAGTVLEIGAGGPVFVRRLTGRGMRVVALDIEYQACQAISPLPAVVADASGHLPLRDGALAGLFMGELIEHLYDTGLLLTECRRVLRPGGCLVLSTPNLAGLQDRIGFLLGRSPRQVDAFHEYLHLHIRPFTSGSLRAGLERHGFQPFAIAGNHVVFRWRNGRRVRLRWPARAFPGLAGSLIVGAIKR
jgi:SAM-dependent methyltransferase